MPQRGVTLLVLACLQSPRCPPSKFSEPPPSVPVPSLACVVHPGPLRPTGGPAGAHRAPQGLQVTGQGLQLATVVVGLVLGLAEQLGIAGSGIVQVGKLGGGGPYAEGRLGPTSRELCGPVGLWEFREMSRTPGLVSRSPQDWGPWAEGTGGPCHVSST